VNLRGREAAGPNRETHPRGADPFSPWGCRQFACSGKRTRRGV
jgi:hypothetical protein